MPKAAQTAKPRTAYLVLGMHRSGTSAATQLLALAGADLPKNVMPGDEHNQKGYFEPWKIALFNDQRLHAGTSAWDDIFGFPYAAMDAAQEAEWTARAVAVFEDEFGSAPHPLMKDPRATVVLPLWRKALDQLGVAARCVIPVRHPLAVAASLARRDGFPIEKSLVLWTAYMLAAEAYTRDLPRVFVGYDALLADWRGEAVRIEAAHGAPLPGLTPMAAAEIDGFLTPDLRHNSAGAGLKGSSWAYKLTRTVFDWCEAAAQDKAPDLSVMDSAGAKLAQVKAEMGVFVSPLTRDLDVARGQLLHAEAVVDSILAAR